MIHPYFIYFIIVWGNASQLALKRLVCLQKRAVRMITCSHYRDPSTPLFAHLRILKLCDIYKLHVLLFMYKVKNGLLPPACCHHVLLSSKDIQYQLRKPNEFESVKFHSQKRKKYIAVTGPELWNTIAISTKTSPSISIFKNRLVCSYLGNYI
jgi:hypothetical protein